MKTSTFCTKTLCAMFLMPMVAFAADTVVQDAPSEQSLLSRVGKWIGWGSPKEKEEEPYVQAKQPGQNAKSEQWKANASRKPDFLPDDYPGLAEYRRAGAYQRWSRRPRHTLQEVYDMYEKSAKKGNPLAAFGQYELSKHFPPADGKKTTYLQERVKQSCEAVYKDAVKGNADIQYLYAKYCFKSGSAQANSWYMRAFKQYEQAAANGEPYAQYMLGKTYQAYGEENTAQDWFSIAAQNGYRNASCEIKPKVFYAKKLWSVLPERLKKGNSCATHTALKVIAETYKDKAVALAAAKLYALMPEGYANSGFSAGGTYYFSLEENDAADLISQHLRKASGPQIQEAEELVEKYKQRKVQFVDEYFDKFSWQQINPFH